MIRIRPVGYLLRAADYFYGQSMNVDTSRSPGIWSGRACQGLGWEPGAEADKADFIAAMRGCNANGLPFGGRIRPDRTPGYDLVVAAPKSVSLATCCLDPSVGRPVQEANLHAATAAFQFLECYAQGRRYAHPRDVHSAALAAIRFGHIDSRDQVPHEHIHFVIVNYTEEPNGGYAGALSERPMFRSLEAVDLVYKTALRDNLQFLGIQVRNTENGPEIAAIPRKTIVAFSDGKKRIDRAEAIAPHPEGGPIDRSTWRNILNDRTRPAKVPLEKQRLLYGLLSPADRSKLQDALDSPALLRDLNDRSEDPREDKARIKALQAIREEFEIHLDRASTVATASEVANRDPKVRRGKPPRPLRTKVAALPAFAVALLDRIEHLRPAGLIRAVRSFLRDPLAGLRPSPVVADPDAENHRQRNRRLLHAQRLRQRRRDADVPGVAVAMQAHPTIAQTPHSIEPQTPVRAGSSISR